MPLQKSAPGRLTLDIFPLLFKDKSPPHDPIHSPPLRISAVVRHISSLDSLPQECSQANLTQHKKTGRGRVTCRVRFLISSENEFACKLEGPRILHAVHFTEVAATHIVVEAIELGVIEGIKALCAELEMSALAQSKRLIQVDTEVDTAGAYYDVPSGITEAQVWAAIPRRDWLREAGGRNPLVHAIGIPLLRVVHLAGKVGTDGVVAAQSDRV